MAEKVEDRHLPVGDAPHRARERLGWRAEAFLLLMPTITILAVLGLVEAITRQRLLFASLASSAFLIYLDPRHTANSVRTLTISQLSAALFGFAASLVLGHGYASAAAALLATIAVMVLFNAVHPPAVSTSFAFALRAAPASNIGLFALAVAVTAVLVIVERASLWALGRFDPTRS